MIFPARDFDDLPEDWSVEEKNNDGAVFSRTDQDVLVRIHQDEDYDTWVLVWDGQKGERLFQQRFGGVGDAIRTAKNLMKFYNSMWDRTVNKIMENVAFASVIAEASQESAEENEDTEKAGEEIKEALQERDYDKIQQVAEGARKIFRDHNESEG